MATLCYVAQGRKSFYPLKNETPTNNGMVPRLSVRLEASLPLCRGLLLCLAQRFCRIRRRRRLRVFENVSDCGLGRADLCHVAPCPCRDLGRALCHVLGLLACLFLFDVGPSRVLDDDRFFPRRDPVAPSDTF